MFHLTRRIQTALPLAWIVAGLAESLALLMASSVIVLCWLVLRHLRIVGLVGVAPWASVGFARHVMVDDLLRLAGRVVISPLPYLVGVQMRHFILAAL
jgi:hypothetical protein